MPELAGIFLGEEVYWIPGFNGSYGVTKTGKVFSAKVHAWIGQFKSNSFNPYMKAYFWSKERGREGYYVHRLIAATFLGLDLRDINIQVDHIDNIRTNNNVTNLRICNQSQNMLWRYGTASKDSCTHKCCRVCKVLKPRSEYYKNDSAFDGISSRCKSCISKEKKLFYKSKLNKEKCK